MTTEKSKLFKINYKEYPEFMFAMIASFLPHNEGHELRRVAGSTVVRNKDKNGNTYKNGAFHSYNDEPAINNGLEKAWYKDGKLHREGDKPALIDFDFGINFNSYYINGKLHRDGDNPAVESESFNKWFQNGKLHREGDLPAIIDGDVQEWWVNGKRHRDGDKPAFNDERTDTQQWWVNGVLIRSYFVGDDYISY